MHDFKFNIICHERVLEQHLCIPELLNYFDYVQFRINPVLRLINKP